MFIGREWPSAIAWCLGDDENVSRYCDPSVLKGKGERRRRRVNWLGYFSFQITTGICHLLCASVYGFFFLFFLGALCQVQVTYRLQESRWVLCMIDGRVKVYPLCVCESECEKVTCLLLFLELNSIIWQVSKQVHLRSACTSVIGRRNWYMLLEYTCVTARTEMCVCVHSSQ